MRSLKKQRSANKAITSSASKLTEVANKLPPMATKPKPILSHNPKELWR